MLDGHYIHCKACEKARTKDRARQTFGGKLLYSYGITLEQYDQLFEAQDGLCAVCGEPETMTNRGIVRRLSVDHDHQTGRVRGLLCANCNTAVGFIEAKPCRLTGIAAYLAQHKEQ